MATQQDHVCVPWRGGGAGGRPACDSEAALPSARTCVMGWAAGHFSPPGMGVSGQEGLEEDAGSGWTPRPWGLLALVPRPEQRVYPEIDVGGLPGSAGECAQKTWAQAPLSVFVSPGCVMQGAWGDLGRLTRVRQHPQDALQAPSSDRQQAHLSNLVIHASKLSLPSGFGCLGPLWRPLMLLGEARPSAGWAFAGLCPDVDPGGCQHPCDALFVETNPRPKSRGQIPGLCHFRRRRPRGARCGPAGLSGSSGPCWEPGRAGLQLVAGQPGGTTQARLWAPHVSAARLARPLGELGGTRPVSPRGAVCLLCRLRG